MFNFYEYNKSVYNKLIEDLKGIKAGENWVAIVFDNGLNIKGFLPKKEFLKLSYTYSITGSFECDFEFPKIKELKEDEYIAIPDKNLTWQIYKVKAKIVKISNTNINKFHCEHIIYDLMQEFPVEGSFDSVSAPQFIEYCLNDTHIYPYYIDPNITATRSFELDLLNPLDALRSQRNNFGYYIMPRCYITPDEVKIFIDFISNEGRNKGKEIRLGYNIKGIELQIDSTNVITALYPIGYDDEGSLMTIENVEKSKASGDSYDKPQGQSYVEDIAATALYGNPDGKGGKRKRIKLFESEASTNDSMCDEAWEKIQRDLAARFNAKVDWLPDEDVELYELYNVLIDEDDFKFVGEVPVIKITWDLLNIENSKCELGEFIKTIFDDNRIIEEKTKSLNRKGQIPTSQLSGNINSNIDAINKIFKIDTNIFELILKDIEGNTTAQFTAANKGFDNLYVGNISCPNAVLKNTEEQTIYFDVSTGDDNIGDGTEVSPFKTFSKCLDVISDHLEYEVTIRHKSAGATITENILIAGHYGDVGLTVGLNGSTLFGYIIVKNSDTVILKDITIMTDYLIQNNICLDVSSMKRLELVDVNAKLLNNTTLSAFNFDNTNALLTRCDVVADEIAIQAEYNSLISLIDCKGNARYGVNSRYASYIAGNTCPNGSTAVTKSEYGGLVYTSLIGTDSAFSPPPVPPTQDYTYSFYSTKTKSWRENYGGQWYSNDDVLQGIYDGWGRYKGLWLFDYADIQSKLNGGTIVSIKLTIKRQNSSGTSASVTHRLRTHNYASIPAGEPTVSAEKATVGLAWGEEKQVTLPNSVGEDLRDNIAKGIAVYTTSTSNNEYSRLYPNAEYKAKLVIVVNK